MSRRKMNRMLLGLAVFIALVVVLLVLSLRLSRTLTEMTASASQPAAPVESAAPVEPVTPVMAQDAAAADEAPDAEPGETEPDAEPTPVPTPTPIPTALPDFQPQAGPNAAPSNQITGTAIKVGDAVVSSYAADEAHYIDFGGAADYTDVKGIVTFRGNNFRNTSQYGTADIVEERLSESWRSATGGTSDINGNYWGGSGWTGQPLVVEWPAATRRIMNMYYWAKEKDGLVEVVYATLGGSVYFYDLETGERTRDPLDLGYTFKGAGALDPRGYPLMYLGGGVTNAYGNSPRIMVVSLISGEVLYTIGNDDSFAPRYWSAYDSSALVDAETDQLIYPGENGILYIIKLNTYYDEANGVIDVSPEPIRFKFTSRTADIYYYGMEDSAIVWRGHLLIADNGGDFICLDLNTLEIEWCFNCLDDTNCTGVLEVDDTGHPYVYLSTSFHLGWRSSYTATIPVWKIDAVTGEEVWHHDYTCYSESSLSGGAQGSLSLGTGPLSGIVYVAMAREPDSYNGQLLALDAATGEELWTYTSDAYSWVTPVCVYSAQGRGYVLYTSSINGKLYLFDGLTGEMCDAFYFGGSTVEATPVVYDNTVVIGTRGQEVYGIQLL